MWFGLLGPGRTDKGYRREHDTVPVCSDFNRDRPHSEIEIFCGTDWGTPMSHDVSAFGFSVYPVIEFDSVEVVGRVVNKLVGVLHYSYSFFIGLCLACFGQ